MSWAENTLWVVTSWPLSGHLVAFFSLKSLTGHKTFCETIKSIQKSRIGEFPVQKFTKKYQKFTIFFICWSKVFTIETALLFLEIFHKLWRHDRWTWNSLNTRYFGSFLKSKFYLLKLFWTLDNAASSFWSFELKEFKQLLFLGCWNEIWNFHMKNFNSFDTFFDILQPDIFWKYPQEGPGTLSKDPN